MPLPVAQMGQRYTIVGLLGFAPPIDNGKMACPGDAELGWSAVYMLAALIVGRASLCIKRCRSYRVEDARNTWKLASIDHSHGSEGMIHHILYLTLRGFHEIRGLQNCQDTLGSARIVVLMLSKVPASAVEDLTSGPWHFSGRSNRHDLFDWEDVSWAVQAQ